MTKGRLEAFSDGVIAILITIMVLELRIPEGDTLDALRPLAPQFSAYVLSFVFLGIYWSNHHHMLHATDRIHGGILWANLHLLFWLSLVPFVTGWMGENHFAPLPTAVYGFNMLAAGISYTILQTSIVHDQGARSRLKQAVGRDRKGKASAILYLLSVPLAFVHQWISGAIFIFIAAMWLVPDRRIEKVLEASASTGETA